MRLRTFLSRESTPRVSQEKEEEEEETIAGQNGGVTCRASLSSYWTLNTTPRVVGEL